MYEKIIGTWPQHDKFLLTSCDEIYLNRFFPRFYKTFTEHWQLPIHVHVIDPSETSKDRLSSLPISFTYCETSQHDWANEIKKFRKYNDVQQDNDIVKQWLYETYCQCQRFILLGAYMTGKQTIVVADVDAYAQRTPTKQDRKLLFGNTAFTVYKGRQMATFCNFHPKDLVFIKKMAKIMLDQLQSRYVLGMDQQAIKSMFDHRESVTDLRNGEWIRHWDVKTEVDQEQHDQCLIYHEKGTRGKDKGKKIKWTDIE